MLKIKSNRYIKHMQLSIIKKLVTTVLCLLILMGCAQSSSDETRIPVVNSRSYYLGFTPLPYAISLEALEYSYAVIGEKADIIAHHFDNGIPWPQSLSGADYHQEIMNDWQYRKNNTPAGHKTYVAITPISITRDGLAPYKNENADMALPSPWDTYAFNHPDVKTAYLNYCRRVIDFFNPDFFCMGVEVNLLMVNSPGSWQAYAELHQYVYTHLKTLYPDLPIMVSFSGTRLVDEYTTDNFEDQMRAFADLIDYTDYYGISLHVFLTPMGTDDIPDDMFDKIFSLSTKPIAICETSYPAESFSVYSGSLTFEGSQVKQRHYFEKLFQSAQNYPVEFIINFVIRDYDVLWEQIGAPDDINKFWKDTGFYDQDGNARSVMDLWANQLIMPVN